MKWRVYLSFPNGKRRPPRDVDYFSDLKRLSEKYGTDQVYQNYVFVYNMTKKNVSDEVLNAISQLAAMYSIDSLQVDKILSILYLAMIAEEQKQNTRLGKRIKRLGIYALLIEDRTVRESANFMRGMGWREIDTLCEARGF